MRKQLRKSLSETQQYLLQEGKAITYVTSFIGYYLDQHNHGNLCPLTCILMCMAIYFGLQLIIIICQVWKTQLYMNVYLYYFSMFEAALRKALPLLANVK